jgi:NTP pyrophosphatase (non-canonical NTP hydrolase)
MSNISFEYTQYQGVTSWYKHVNEYNAPELAYLSMGLAGESGEFVDNVKKLVREIGFMDDHMYNYKMDQHVQEALIDELGDVLWYLNKLCTFLGLTIEDLMVLNTVKLHERWGIPNSAKWPFESITFEQAKGEDDTVPF